MQMKTGNIYSVCEVPLAWAIKVSAFDMLLSWSLVRILAEVCISVCTKSPYSLILLIQSGFRCRRHFWMVRFNNTASGGFRETVTCFREHIPGDRPNRVDFCSLYDKNKQNF